MQFIDLLVVRWIFWGSIEHKNYEDFEHPRLGDIVGRSGCFSLNLSDNSVMRGRAHAIRTLKGLVADLRI